MPHQFTFTTEDPGLAARIFELMNGGPHVASAPMPKAAKPAPTVAAPTPVAAPAPAAAPAAAPMLATDPPIPVVQPVAEQGQAVEGWTVDHVKHAAATLAQNPSKGPAAVKRILDKYGSASVAAMNPAVYHLAYQDMMAEAA